MKPETTMSFEHAGEFAPVVTQWAKDEGYRHKGVVDGYETFQKGYGILVAPMMFAYRQDGRKVQAKAWVPCNLLVRILSLFILPSSMGIESGGFRGVAPRRIARGTVNRLLERIKQPAIP
jgi:hypothetical protein